jgi:branched-chain amino acid transport system substrate-binding protein
MRKVLVVLLVVLGLGGLAQAQTTVRVGVLLPINTVAGRAALNGVQLGVEQVNAGGRVRIELVVVDDGNAPATAIPAFTRLMTVDRVDIVIGGLTSAVAFALSGPVKRFEPLFLAVGAASSVVEQAFSDYGRFFHYHPWDYHNVAAALEFFQHLHASGARRVAILYEDGPFGSFGIQTYRQRLQDMGFTVQAERFRSGSGSFTAILSRFRAFRPDILYWIGFDVDALPIAAQTREVGLEPKLIYGAPPAWPLGFERNRLSNDIVGMTAWLSTVTNSESRRFVAAYRRKFGEVTDEYMAPMGYVIALSLGRAIEAANSADKDRIAAELARVRMDTPFGPLSFGPSDTGLTRFQGFNQSIWFHFQYLEGSRRPVFPLNRAARPLRFPGSY